MAKMDKKWVVLCSTAIAAVYTAGYWTTNSQMMGDFPLQAAPTNLTAAASLGPSPSASSAAQPLAYATPAVETPKSTNPPAAAATAVPTATQQPRAMASAAAPTAAPSPSKAAPATSTATPKPTTAPAAASTVTPKPTTAVTAQASKRYKDGTFSGVGRNRRGAIETTVTIKNDKIIDVEISQFAMHYSERDVVGLPSEVLQKQSAQVANVSGATYSVQAFKDGVQSALAQALNS